MTSGVVVRIFRCKWYSKHFLEEHVISDCIHDSVLFLFVCCSGDSFDLYNFNFKISHGNLNNKEPLAFVIVPLFIFCAVDK